MATAATRRHYLMCRPTYFTVSYAINPWMHPDVAVDTDLAVAQWENLRRIYLDLGHEVSLIDPVPGLPDMVFAANGAVVVDGLAFGARFRHLERMPESTRYLEWFKTHGVEVGVRDAYLPLAVAEGEGDLLTTPARILAGTGFRTDPAAHRELEEYVGREVVSLELVDPRFYHLDTALAVLDDETIVYYPAAFSAGSRQVLGELYPDALLAEDADAVVLGLNAVSDGRHVVLPVQATGLARQLAERGFEPVTVDLSELRKSGGGPKCCTLEIRPEIRPEVRSGAGRSSDAR
ncbi:dimethylargininase [Actinopolymorpha pittospori]|uniref:N-dimethylarginine dimethylaminohydrolase n=1 Tax=Actinopolymorpha pittospori TaxID=648752 RepID=A0A927RC14_9ACTN|nr:dimethylargininase [Actinopolymorpha pittospori]MBE1610757.1 N-dimethylarginine dimethylaminohydrolase [Actinopolymorpha pittospori]